MWWPWAKDKSQSQASQSQAKQRWSHGGGDTKDKKEAEEEEEEAIAQYNCKSLCGDLVPGHKQLYHSFSMYFNEKLGGHG